MGGLTELPGIGKVTALAITEALDGEVPTYLRRMRATEGADLDDETAALRAALKGDLHSHSRLVRRRLADRGDGRGGRGRSATSTWR